jgi:uroporphyrin-III C-methyltransferase
LTVVRLKQGDPVIYGRAGEEILYFRSHGFEPLVIPGVSSAIAAPTFAGIPITQRGVAESFIVCTGVGRKGKDVLLPGYVRSRTLILLMGVARLSQIITALVDPSNSQNRRDGVAFPPYTPIAIIERASMPDQRVIMSTLKDIVKALDSNGEQRPPGTMVIGWSVLALSGNGDVTVLDDYDKELDEERVSRWLGGSDAVGWKVQEGLDRVWESLEGMDEIDRSRPENN